MTAAQLDKLFAAMPNDRKVLVDVKSVLDKQTLLDAGYRFWRL